MHIHINERPNKLGISSTHLMSLSDPFLAYSKPCLPFLASQRNGSLSSGCFYVNTRWQMIKHDGNFHSRTKAMHPSRHRVTFIGSYLESFPVWPIYNIWNKVEGNYYPIVKTFLVEGVRQGCEITSALKLVFIVINFNRLHNFAHQFP